MKARKKKMSHITIEQLQNILSWVYKALSASVIPLLYWLNSISIENAVIKNNMYVMQQQISKIDYQLYEVKREMINNQVLDARAQQGLKDLEKSIDGVQRNLTEIQKILIQHEEDK